MSHRSRWAWLSLVVLMLATGEWLRRPTLWWVAVAGGAMAAVWWLHRSPPPQSWGRRVVLATSVGILAAMIVTARRLRPVESDWPAVRRDRIEHTVSLLKRQLVEVSRRLDELAGSAAAAVALDRTRTFGILGDAVNSAGPAYDVAVFDSAGTPWAWAGRWRFAPAPALAGAPAGDVPSVGRNRYYLRLERRRAAGGGRTVLATATIVADSAAAGADRTIAAEFAAATGVPVQLEVFPPNAVPVGDSAVALPAPAAAPAGESFGIRPTPPDQGSAKERILRQGRTAVSWLILLFLMASLASAPRSRDRYALLLAQLLVLLRAPMGQAMGLGEMFSSATFFRPLVGPFSSSVGLMAVTGMVVTIIGVALWRRRLRRTWIGVLVGTAALVTAPDMYRELGRGITPPADGVSLSLWLTWQFMMVFSAAGLFFIAAAMFRGRREVAGTGWRLRLTVGVVLALGAAVSGTFLWSLGWPPFYTAFWIPPLFLVVLPAPRRPAAVAIALVAGSAAAMVTWGAVLEGSVNVARRDVARLGEVTDPLTVASLERFVEQIRSEPPVTNAADLFARWRSSELGREGYPARLAVWSGRGDPQSVLALDSLAITSREVGRLVAGLDPDSASAVRILPLVPGTHYLLLVRTSYGRVLSVAVGPQTRLISPTRAGRILRQLPGETPLYRISMSRPLSGRGAPDVTPLTWRRRGWMLHGHQLLAYPDGVRRVDVEVDLRGPVPVLVRGALIILLDVALVSFLWLLAEWLAGRVVAGPDWRRLTRSYRSRLAVALSLFFVLPAVGFSTWSFARLRAEAMRGRDLLTNHLLTDAASIATDAVGPPAAAAWEQELPVLSDRINAEFWAYREPRLAAVSEPALADLGFIRTLLPPSAYLDLEYTRDAGAEAVGESAGAGRRSVITREAGDAERIGYRAVDLVPPPVAGEPGGVADRVAEPAAAGRWILATPQQPLASGLATEQRDLAYVLLLATLAGLVGALIAAQYAARALARPVADLRRSAVAVGQGRPLPQPERTPPLEFEPVFGAFVSMEHDIRTSRARLEAARRRTATVLATVATGVVAVDHDGAVIIANRRAAEFLGVELAPGTLLPAALGPEWSALVEAVECVTADQGPRGHTTELDVRERRYSVHCASLGPDPGVEPTGGGVGGGIVIALTDVTDMAQAERVLAWGEMARQVAHEIKNPLTPMRLGMQHLERVYRERPDTFGPVLGETGSRILAEIDRLDRIARSFSRFAAPAEGGEAAPLERVDLAEVGREVVQLYGLAPDRCRVELVVDDPVAGDAPRAAAATAAARRDEVKEVLVNLVENARQAGADRVVVEVGPGRMAVSDDGAGIPDELRARIFEPRFSTTSSGAGLGLAIVRRLVESWGARIDVESVVGRGTTVTVRLAEPPAGSDKP